MKRLFEKPTIAMDLGTANTRVYLSSLGRIAEEPTVVRHTNPKSVTQASDEYSEYLNSRLVSMPLRGGVIVDIRYAITFLKPLVQQSKKLFRQPVSLACAPTDTSEKERSLLANAVLKAGASHVAIVPEVWAAAIGAGVDVNSSRAQVLIDIGEGVTDLAGIRDGRLIHAAAVRTACSDLQKAIRNVVMANQQVYLYPTEVERLTHELVSMSQPHETGARSIQVRGISVTRRCGVVIDVTTRDILSAMQPVVNNILQMIVTGLKKVPGNIFAEISESGIRLTGGGACIRGFDQLISSRTALEVTVGEDPIHSVINGAARTVDSLKDKDGWWKEISWPRCQSFNF